MRVATPSTVDCVTPHEFHGMRTDVTEMESSRERLSNRGSKPFFLYKLRNKFPPNKIDKYWSPVQQLRNSPLPMVALTVCFSVCILFVNPDVIAFSIPVPIKVPPKIIAHKTRYMVGIIPAIPPVQTSESRSVLPVEIDVSVARMSMHNNEVSIHEEVYPRAEMI